MTQSGGQAPLPQIPGTQGLGEPLHRRTYDVEVFKVDDAKMRLVGRIRDVKPNGAHFIFDDSVEVHHMTLVLDVSVPDLVITDVQAQFLTMPNEECPSITNAYEKVVGLSVKRGFNNALKEAVGGVRGCSHITMLVQAMAPVVHQGFFGFFEVDFPEPGTPEMDAFARTAFEFNRGSCHFFADGGPGEQRVESGQWRAPLFLRQHAEKHGLDFDEIRRRHRERRNQAPDA